MTTLIHIVDAPDDCWIVAGTPGALVDVVRYVKERGMYVDQHGNYPLPQPAYWLSDMPSICPSD